MAKLYYVLRYSVDQLRLSWFDFSQHELFQEYRWLQVRVGKARSQYLSWQFVQSLIRSGAKTSKHALSLDLSILRPYA
jgi:hypothetical protein